MAIETYAGSGNFTTRYAFEENGYFFTVGPSNGSKLYQPGTRGLVVKDSSLGNFPTVSTIAFRLKDNSTSSRWWPTTTSYSSGYASMAYTSYSTGAQSIHKQLSTVSTLGMDSFLQTTANSYDDGTDAPFFLFPCKTTTSDYGINASRWGDKKVNGDIYLVNDDSGEYSTRYVHVEASVYKYEIYTVVSVRDDVRIAGVVNKFTNAYACYMDNNAAWHYVTMNLLKEATIEYGGVVTKLRLFGIESRQNVLTRGNYFFPVFRVSNTASALWDVVFRVQTIFCFKAN